MAVKRGKRVMRTILKKDRETDLLKVLLLVYLGQLECIGNKLNI